MYPLFFGFPSHLVHHRALSRVPLCYTVGSRCSITKSCPYLYNLKLKLQYFGHLMRRVDSLEKTLMLGGIGGRRRRGRQRMRWLDGITDSMQVSLTDTPGVGDGQGGLVCRDSWGRKESDTTERLIWSNLIWCLKKKKKDSKSRRLNLELRTLIVYHSER